MRVLVLSDSHGNVENMVRAVELVQPNAIFYLGDGWQDAQKLTKQFPQIPLEQVPGNCDFRPEEPSERLVLLENVRILLCHGHTYGVKQSLISAGYAAEEQQLDLFLFGHTHRPFCDIRKNTTFLNPGSIGNRISPSYGVLTLQDGQLRASLYTLPPL